MAADDFFPIPEPAPDPLSAAPGAVDDNPLGLLAFFPLEPVIASGDALATFLASLDVEMAAVAQPDEPASPDPKPAAALAGRHVVFNLGDTRYALPLQSVLEMTDTPVVTPVPFVPDWVLGVTNLRGDILAVLDLGTLFALPPLSGSGPKERTGRLLVTRNGSGDVQAGLLVDGVHGITTIGKSEIAPPGSSVRGKVAAFLTGVGEREGRLLALLDPDAIFASPEVRRLWQS